MAKISWAWTIWREWRLLDPEDGVFYVKTFETRDEARAYVKDWHLPAIVVKVEIKLAKGHQLINRPRADPDTAKKINALHSRYATREEFLKDARSRGD